MILDKQLEFSNAQDAAPFNTGANLGDKSYDKEHAFDLGPGGNLTVRFLVTADIDGTTSTVDFQVVTAATEGLASSTLVASSGAIAEAALLPGYHVDVEIPKSGVTGKFIGVNYQVGVNDLSTGAVSAFIVQDAQNNETFVS